MSISNKLAQTAIVTYWRTNSSPPATISPHICCRQPPLHRLPQFRSCNHRLHCLNALQLLGNLLSNAVSLHIVHIYFAVIFKTRALLEIMIRAFSEWIFYKHLLSFKSGLILTFKVDFFNMYFGPQYIFLLMYPKRLQENVARLVGQFPRFIKFKFRSCAAKTSTNSIHRLCFTCTGTAYLSAYVQHSAHSFPIFYTTST